MHMGKIPAWLDILALVFVVLVSLMSGGVFFFIGLFAWFCARKCYSWAEEMEGHPKIAFALGLFFPMISLIIYWIIILVHRKKQ